MTENQPPPGTELCRLDEIADGQGRVFTWGGGKDAYSLIVVRRGEAASAFVNVCPHFHISLDHRGTLTTFREFVLCSHHYAAFRADDGYCVEGPCEGASLTAVPIALECGTVRLGGLPPAPSRHDESRRPVGKASAMTVNAQTSTSPARRPLGGSPLEIPPLVFGGNVLGWTADETRSFDLLDRLLDAGFNAIDTADVYSRWAPGHSGGESETVLGRWMKQRGNRDRVLVLTKVGMEMPEGSGLSSAWIARAAQDSLRRLQTDRIDLYQAHRDDAATPLEETLAAFGKLIEDGSVRAIGASNYSGARLSEALAASKKMGLPRYEILQPQYNLVERADYEADLEPVCIAEHIGVITYFSLASGFLTGKYRSEADCAKSARGGSVKKYLNAHGERVLAALDDVARRYDATPSQVSLAWLVARPSVTAPIASATNLDQLEELVRGATLQIDREAIDQLETASAVISSDAHPGAVR